MYYAEGARNIASQATRAINLVVGKAVADQVTEGRGGDNSPSTPKGNESANKAIQEKFNQQQQLINRYQSMIAERDKGIAEANGMMKVLQEQMKGGNK